MSIAVTLDSGSPHRMGLCKASYGSLAMDSSCPAAGEPIAANEVGFHSAIYAMEFSGALKGTRLHWDYLTQRVMATPIAMQREILNPAQAAKDLTAVAADVTTFQVGKAMYVLGFSSVVTTLLACETIQPVMSIEKRDPDGAANAVELATITYGATDAVGTVDSVFSGGGAVGGGVAVATLPYLVPAGYTLVLKHKTRGTGAAAAGAAKCHVWVAIADPAEAMPDGFNMAGLTAARFTAYGW